MPGLPPLPPPLDEPPPLDVLPETEARPAVTVAAPLAPPSYPPGDTDAGRRKAAAEEMLDKYQVKTCPVATKTFGYDDWKHGIIEFEDTGFESKYLIVPEHCNSGEQLLAVMTYVWKLTLPQLLIEFVGAEGHYKQLYEDVIEWKEDGKLSDNRFEKHAMKINSFEELSREEESKNQKKEDTMTRKDSRRMGGRHEEGSDIDATKKEEKTNRIRSFMKEKRIEEKTWDIKIEDKDKKVIVKTLKEHDDIKDWKKLEYPLNCFFERKARRSDEENLSSKIGVFTEHVMDACEESGGWIINKSQARSAYYNTNSKNPALVVDGKSVLMAEGMKNFRNKYSNSKGLVSMVYSCLPAVYGQEALKEGSVALDKDPTEKVKYPNVRWFDEKGKWNNVLKTYCEEHLKETMHSGQHHLYSRLPKDAKITPATSLSAYTATHILLFESMLRDKVQNLLLNGLHQLGISSAPVYMHGDYFLLNKLKKDTETDLAFLLQGTGGATDVLAEFHRLYKKQGYASGLKSQKKGSHHVVQVEYPPNLPSKVVEHPPRKEVFFSMKQFRTENVKVCNILWPTEQVIDELLLFMNMAKNEDYQKVGEKKNDVIRLREAGYLYCLYRDNEFDFWWWSNVVEILTVLLSFFTTIASIAVTYITYKMGKEPEFGLALSPDDFGVFVLSWSCTCLPVFSSFVLAISQAFNPRQKWAQLSNAANLVESAIWKYRARVGKYRNLKSGGSIEMLHAGEHGALVKVAEKKKEERRNPRCEIQNCECPWHKKMEQSSKGGSTHSGQKSSTETDIKLQDTRTSGKVRTRREEFQKELTQIQDMVRGSELKVSNITSRSIRDQFGLEKRYEHHMENKKPTKKKSSWYCCRCCRRGTVAPDDLAGGDIFTQAKHTGQNSNQNDGSFEGAEVDVEKGSHIFGETRKAGKMSIEVASREFCFGCFKSCGCCKRRIDVPPISSGLQLSAEEYIDGRLRRSLANFENLVPRLNYWHMFLRVMMIVATSVNAVFALLPLKQWIPAFVALASLLHTIIKDQMLTERLTACNIAIMKLQNLLIWWNSLTLVQRRMPTNFERLVVDSEELVNADMVWLPNAAKDFSSQASKKEVSSAASASKAKGSDQATQETKQTQ